jgi:hypothetical protein
MLVKKFKMSKIMSVIRLLKLDNL